MDDPVAPQRWPHGPPEVSFRTVFAGVLLLLGVGALASPEAVQRLLLLGLAACVGGLVAGGTPWARVLLLRLVGMGCAGLVAISGTHQLASAWPGARALAVACVFVATAVSFSAFTTARRALARLRGGST
ncbi:MAG: hypothetical protein H6732_06225 [Alphaproteobacteria bacterium]|nr:hypothetical protein [Alphaproteobacteria bacterium]